MTTTVTSLKRQYPDAPSDEQLPYWVEIQLVDEQGDAVANIPWKAESYHPTCGAIEPFTHSGVSDAQGLIRIDMPHGLELKLTLEADPLATEMEKRILRPGRDSEQDSLVRQSAEDRGYLWHYAVIGELCQTTPSFKLREKETWPPFHFPPGRSFKGLTIRTNELEKRHIVEICPFRAWELILHHQKEYSIANAINLGGAAAAAYADDNVFAEASITRLFIDQCLDLSRLPQAHKGTAKYNMLVQDVPFSERYYYPVFLDTSDDNSGDNDNAGQANDPSKKADGDTQLYYVRNNKEIIVSWRGTASLYDTGTDLVFRPVETQSCDINKVKCTLLFTEGRVHEGFWNGYCRADSKFREEMTLLEKLSKKLDFFICGHSLGGALALIHAASLKEKDPLLYTYGMPRTFTKDAMSQLSSITHFRHVNDSDPVPAVPPEANVDNYFYNIWGLPGTVLGAFWSVIEIMAWQLVEWGNCFWHHGNPVVFLTTTQCRQWQECKVTLPYPMNCMTIKKMLPVSVKLFLVPELATQSAMEAGEKQKAFKKTLTKEDLETFFPPGGNNSRGIDITFGDHFMTAYMPYINNKLLELIDNEDIINSRNFIEHASNVTLFEEQMSNNKDEIPAKEFERNEIFLQLDKMLRHSLTPTLNMPLGNNSLERFALYGEEEIENE